MYHTTGFSHDQIIDICVRVISVCPEPDSRKWPPVLGLFKSVVAALTYMRHNRTQGEIGESFGVSQPTISRAVSVITPLLARCMRQFTPTADDLDPDAQYIVDGTLLPCWSWRDRPKLYSGKHKTTGVNVQVACTIYGRLSWISDPITGNHHDNSPLGVVPASPDFVLTRSDAATCLASASCANIRAASSRTCSRRDPMPRGIRVKLPEAQAGCGYLE